jgi:peroxiredoxin
MNRRHLLLTGAGAFALQAQGGGKTHLKAGDMAPDFKLPVSNAAQPVSLSEFKGKNTVVLAFFPAAFTGG